VSSEDVNDYLRESAGADYTAKDFRTWGGTVLAAVSLHALEGFESEAEAKRNVIVAIDRVARRLGNTRAVSRRSYVHPAVIDSYLDHKLAEALTRRTDRRQDGAAATPSVEAAVLKLIGRRHS
jgi:DNA topoisomerase I